MKKTSFRELITEFKPIIIVVIIMTMILSGFILAINRCKDTDRFMYYGNDDYYFVMVVTGSGKSEHFYEGVIKVKDYDRWVNGDEGTVFVYKASSNSIGYRLAINHISSIVNYGSEPDWLPLTF